MSLNEQETLSIVLISGYTHPLGHTAGLGDGIYAFYLTKDGYLHPIKQSPYHIIPTTICGKNPSWIHIIKNSNENGMIDNNTFKLFVCNESGGVESPNISSPLHSVDLKLVSKTNKKSNKNISEYMLKTSHINVFSSFGKDPCYMSTYMSHNVSNDNYLYYANYTDGSFGIYNIIKENNKYITLSQKPIIVKKFAANSGSNVNKERQLSSHVHCIIPHPMTPFEFYVAVFGKDKIQHYSFVKEENIVGNNNNDNNNSDGNNMDGGSNSNKVASALMDDGYKSKNENEMINFSPNEDNPYYLYLESEMDMKPGSGPRHFCFHPKNCDIMYVSEELHCAVSLLYLNIKGNDNKLKKIIQTISTIPQSYVNEQKKKGLYNNENGSCEATSSDLLIDPKYNKFLFVLNRVYNSVVKYEIDVRHETYKLHNPIWYSTNGEIPRHMNVDPSGKFLLICNQEGNFPNVSIFQINYHKSCDLQLVSSVSNVGSPSCVQFITLPVIKYNEYYDNNNDNNENKNGENNYDGYGYNNVGNDGYDASCPHCQKFIDYNNGNNSNNNGFGDLNGSETNNRQLRRMDVSKDDENACNCVHYHSKL